ncbi:hypothetical protein [Galbibacter mesophilus]|uniref:hypothetical protein n=1 Tax=Galbibacter mesophilus TaxID=379069 RepID=UPI00191DA8E1|nr:hypothetical protein [Galbibacter mesophilus]MCM5662127.1 hypothetical protein [Galbibacter mesophilus]
MKKRLLFAIFSFFMISAIAQEKEVNVGDVFTINSISKSDFSHIELPRKNIIIKRGGVPDYKTVFNNEVVVTEVSTNNDGEQIARLKRTDGRKFFSSFPTVTANVNRALEAEELTF